MVSPFSALNEYSVKETFTFLKGGVMKGLMLSVLSATTSWGEVVSLEEQLAVSSIKNKTR